LTKINSRVIVEGYVGISDDQGNCARISKGGSLNIIGIVTQGSYRSIKSLPKFNDDTHKNKPNNHIKTYGKKGFQKFSKIVVSSP